MEFVSEFQKVLFEKGYLIFAMDQAQILKAAKTFGSLLWGEDIHEGYCAGLVIGWIALDTKNERTVSMQIRISTKCFASRP